MGFFTVLQAGAEVLADLLVAIPFRVGWGFSQGAYQVFPVAGPSGRNPFQGGMGFFTERRVLARTSTKAVAIPFRVGWGFSPGVVVRLYERGNDLCRNPFQGGMGFFTLGKARTARVPKPKVAIPFRVGWGFSLIVTLWWLVEGTVKSQSLSGWDGVFHQGHSLPPSPHDDRVAIPFRVGWGFSRGGMGIFRGRSGILSPRRNPFQGGMGFFTEKGVLGKAGFACSRNPFQGGMGFFTPVSPDRLGCKPAAAFRQPQVCPPKTSKKL